VRRQLDRVGEGRDLRRQLGDLLGGVAQADDERQAGGAGEAYSVSSHCSGGSSDHSSVLTMPCGISAMFGVGGSAARVEIVFATSPPAPPSAQASMAAPSRTGGPAAGRIGLRKRRPQTSVVRSAISLASDRVASSRDG
jgi:hypothetical protein